MRNTTGQPYKKPALWQLLPAYVAVSVVCFAILLYIAPLLSVMLYPLIGEDRTGALLDYIGRYRTNILVWFTLAHIPLIIVYQLVSGLLKRN